MHRSGPRCQAPRGTITGATPQHRAVKPVVRRSGADRPRGPPGRRHAQRGVATSVARAVRGERAAHRAALGRPGPLYRPAAADAAALVAGPLVVDFRDAFLGDFQDVAFGVFGQAEVVGFFPDFFLTAFGGDLVFEVVSGRPGAGFRG